MFQPNDGKVIPNRNVCFILLALLVVGLGLRLICLRSPLLDAYSWRQVVTAMLAKNFHHHGYHLLWPEISYTGNAPAWVDSEFPLYPYSVALLYGVFGDHEMIGRLLNVLLSLLIIYLIFLLGARHFGTTSGLWAAGFYAVSPLTVYFGRSFLPDLAMVFFGIAGLYALSRALEEKRYWFLFLSALSLSLSSLIKPTILHMLLPLVYLWWRAHGFRFLLKPVAWLWLLAILLPTPLWYHHARHLGQLSGIGFFSVATGSWLSQVGQWEPGQLARFVSRLLLFDITPIGFLFLVVALFRRSESAGKLYVFWFAAVLIYIAFWPHGNMLHHYYQLPLIPPVALLLGAVLGSTKRPLQTVLYGALMVFSLVPAYYSLASQPWYTWKDDILVCSKAVQQTTSPQDLIISIDDVHGGVLYYSDRKGFFHFADAITVAKIQQDIRQGARTLAIASMEDWKKIDAKVQLLLKTDWKLIVSTDQYRVYRLRQEGTP